MCFNSTYEYLALSPPEELRQRVWNGRHGELWHYRFTSGLPLRDGDDALSVNWCELTITHETTGKRLFRNSFATNLPFTADTVADIVLWGRCRWKLENNGFNVLKTKGYHFEHNYGHGSKPLQCANHAPLVRLLVPHHLRPHPPGLSPGASGVGAARHLLPRHPGVARYRLFTSWEALLAFMVEGLELTPDTS
jgi:hypothetical protein